MLTAVLCANGSTLSATVKYIAIHLYVYLCIYVYSSFYVLKFVQISLCRSCPHHTKRWSGLTYRSTTVCCHKSLTTMPALITTRGSQHAGAFRPDVFVWFESSAVWLQHVTALLAQQTYITLRNQTQHLSDSQRFHENNQFVPAILCRTVSTYDPGLRETSAFEPVLETWCIPVIKQ